MADTPYIIDFNDVQLNVIFNEAVQRANIKSGDNIAIAFGKIKKYLSDLGDAAFTDVDSALSDSSANPVQNQVITTAMTAMTQAQYEALQSYDYPLYFIYET